MLSLRKIAQIVAEIEEINNGFVDFDKYQEIIKKYKVLKLNKKTMQLSFLALTLNQIYLKTLILTYISQISIHHYLMDSKLFMKIDQ